MREIIGRVADKYTMLALETLEQHGRLRFARLSKLVGGMSQGTLTRTLCQMEADGLVVRTVFPISPPRAEEHWETIMAALEGFEGREV